VGHGWGRAAWEKHFSRLKTTRPKQMANNEEPSPEGDSTTNDIDENSRCVKRKKSRNTDKRKKSVDGLVSWLASHDAVISSVEEKNVPGTHLYNSNLGSGRGLFATTQIKEGDLLIRIPAECLLNLDTLGPLHARYPTYLPIITNAV
jgi:hypothetical protein